MFLSVFVLIILAATTKVAAQPNNNTIDADQDIRTDTPSGLPVPRFVSLKSGRTNCRTGPSLQHPKRLTFARKGLPVLITAETTNHWRKIADYEGDTCWVHATLLSGTRTALVREGGGALLARNRPDARVRAHLDHTVIVKVRKCRALYCEVSVDRVGGWISRDHLWGYGGEYWFE